MTGLKLLATGSAVPKRQITNDDLAKIVDTSDEWISTRTGIKTRYYAQDENSVSLSTEAAIKALESGNIDRDEIGFVIVATYAPEYLSPSVACLVHKALSLSEDVMAFDLNAACTGFIYALRTVHALLLTKPDKKALVIGCELLSKTADFTDRSTCVLFGDGAGAVVAALDPDTAFYCHIGTQGDCDMIFCPGIPNADLPEIGLKQPEYRPMKVHMNGKEVFRFAVEKLPLSALHVCRQAGIDIADIDYIVCHQANARIISYVQKKMELPQEKFFMNIETYGNTSEASIPLALDDMNRQGLLRRGMRLVLVGFGAGFTWGGCLLTW